MDLNSSPPDFLEVALNTVSDGIWITDADDRMVFFNTQMEIIAGVPADQVLGLCVIDDFPPETTQHFLTHYQKAKSTLHPVKYQAYVVTLAGRETIQSGLLKPLITDGQYSGMVCTISDVTEKQLLAKSIEQMVQGFSSLSRKMPIMFHSVDRDGRLVTASETWLDTLGYQREEILGKRSTDFLTKESRKEADEIFMPAISRDGYLQNAPLQFVTKTEEVVDVLVSVYAECDDNGQITHMMVISSNVTKQRQYEKALLESEEKFRILTDASPTGIYLTDENGQCVYANPRLLTILDMTFAEALGIGWTNALHPDDRARVESSWIKSVESEQTWCLDYRFISKQGKVYWVQGTAEGYRNNEGDIQGYIGNIIDLSQRKAAEEGEVILRKQLELAQRMESIGRLAGGVAHDFNNMLSIILGCADLSLEILDQDHPARLEILKIERAAQRSATLTKQLLGFARRQTASPESLDLNTTLESALDMLKRLIGENIELNYRPGPQPCAVKIDPSQVDQVLTNLLINARDAIDGAGEINVTTGITEITDGEDSLRRNLKPGPYVTIAISDNGSGMDEETQNHIFEPFFTRKSESGGTGLGLAMVFGIITQNHGHIEVESKLGQGSTFKIFLPCHDFQNKEKSDTEFLTDTHPLYQGTILLVEDEREILALNTLRLEKFGYKVLPADRPSVAITLAEEHPEPIELLLTDVVMPEMNGMVLAQKLAQSRPQMACLFTSGYPRDALSDEGFLDPEIHFLQKPFSNAELKDSVKSVLED